MSQTVTQHLLTYKLIALDEGFIDHETVLQLYYDMTDNAVFTSSLVTDHKGGDEAMYTGVPDAGRVSETAFQQSFTDFSKKVTQAITQKICDLLATTPDQFEPWQCVRYATGGKFAYHDDCGNWASNERLYTVMLTLRAPVDGGETHFPKLNITVPSKSARLLIWRNLNEDYLCDGQTVHAGLPVGVEGSEDEKMIIVTWIRCNKYDP